MKDALRDEIPPGTLYLLVLKTLHRGENHGYGIAQSIGLSSGQVLQVEEGSLYPALQRMLLKGWLACEWRQTENNRRARYYKLTASGRKKLAEERTQFRRVHGAIMQVLET
jgi:transcriptional regulator